MIVRIGNITRIEPGENRYEPKDHVVAEELPEISRPAVQVPDVFVFAISANRSRCLRADKEQRFSVISAKNYLL